MDSPDAEPPTDWDQLIRLGRFPDADQAHDHALVILATGEPCWIRENPDGSFDLMAETWNETELRAELEIYAQEQLAAKETLRRPPPVESFHHPAGWGVLAIWLGILIGVFHLQNENPSLVDRAASSSLGLLTNHEWWRPFTALFLHSDGPHLIGNSVSGAIFGTLVSRSLGPLRGWMLILLCGTAANTLTSLTRYPESYQALGASSAVFGALGILAGLGFTHSLRDHSAANWARVASPVVAGLVLLAWLGDGSGNPNTDVLGHAFGFCSGLTVGWVAGEIRQRAPRPPQPVIP